MKKLLLYMGLAAFALAAGFPADSHGDVKITLKNKSEIVAEECREESDRLVCFRMGGSFEIDRKDIESVKNISGGQGYVQEIIRPDPEPAAGEDKKIEKQDEAKKTEAAASEGDKGKAAAKPVDPLAQKKALLQADRDRLIKEKQQVEEDTRNAPTWMPVKQFDELNRRNTELDEKIKRFNEEANRMLEEDRKLNPAPKK